MITHTLTSQQRRKEERYTTCVTFILCYVSELDISSGLLTDTGALSFSASLVESMSVVTVRDFFKLVLRLSVAKSESSKLFLAADATVL